MFSASVRNTFHAATDVEDDVAQADHFGGDVAEAVDAEQLAVVGAEDQLQQPTVARR